MKLDKFSEKINMDELYQRKNEIEQNRTKTYQKILSRVHTKIKVTSRQKTTEQFCFFIIPEFIIGLPRYDSATCTAYIIDKLLENGFQTKYTHPNLLHISWKEKPKSIEPPPSDDRLGLLNSGNNNQNSIYHSTDIKTLEFKTDNLFS